MANIKMSSDFEKYISQIEGLMDNTTPILKQVVYDGAGVIADAVRTEIQAIPEGEMLRFNGKQKQGLLAGLGISQIRNSNGKINAKIGMNGYNSIVTKKYKKGQPNAMIARSLISGTSFSPKYDFVKKAVNKTKKQAEEAMKNRFDDLLTKEMGD